MRPFISLLILIVVLHSCSPPGKQESNSSRETESTTQIYTCPMHPHIEQHTTGTCPICGMQLVLKNKHTAHDLMLNDSQIRLANISTQKIDLQNTGQTLATNGRLVVDPQYTEVVSSRAAGRVEKLFIKEPGRLIKKGEPLYALYSETLFTLQKEFLLAKEQHETLGKTEARYESFLKASEKKLLLYGLSANQIAQLAKTKSVQQRITFVAPSSGVITEINVSEGQYMSEGTSLYKLENIVHLWLEAEIYPHEESIVKIGDKITIRVTGDEFPVEATITFLSPAYRANTQLTILRASVNNQELKFIPGSAAQVHLTTRTKKTLAIPIDAVIRDKNGMYVYVQRGQNTFRPQLVKIGIEDFNTVEITDGLRVGDTVVVTGAYLLNSEFILKKGADALKNLSTTLTN